MIIDIPEAKVCEVLLDIGYYRLGFYWHPYQMNKSHQFKVGIVAFFFKLQYIITILIGFVNARSFLHLQLSTTIR
jgi:hypothetical protein